MGQQIQVNLIRQDASDCANSTVPDDPDRQCGVVTVVRNDDGVTTVLVGVNVHRNTTYDFYLKCVRELGQISTDDDGVGEGKFSFQTSDAGDVFAFDCYTNPPTSGDVYQSCTVRF